MGIWIGSMIMALFGACVLVGMIALAAKMMGA